MRAASPGVRGLAMSMQKKPQMAEAVLFFNDSGVCKEMLYPEFEALLDGLVRMPEYADRQMHLAYVLINPRLQARAAVFFYLDFDEQGGADTGWNLPLRNLAERAGRGPDMGGGPIRLACRSQCPVSWHQMHLWDPESSAGRNHFVLIRDALRRNQLGLLVDEEPAAVEPQRLQMAAEEQWYAAGPAAPKAPPAEPPRKQEDEQTARLAQLVKQQRQQLAALARQQEQRLAGLARQHEEELARREQDARGQLDILRSEVLSLQQALERQARENAELQQRLLEQGEQFQRNREELTRQLRFIENQGRNETDLLRSEFADELEARVAAAVAGYKEQVSIRDVELAYRNELDQQLEQELAELRAERDRLAAQGPEQLLERLSGQGVVFVAYHPGAGHLTIPLQDIPRYQDNPLAYAAAKCFVSESQCRQWLDHFQQPRCEALLPGGERCNLPLDRVDNPARFVAGDTNCCARHKTTGRLRTVS
ncbi:chromosome partitioning protein ParA [Pseudomonas aeruginosa]|uniref:chromosome partitioning protein ParA n=1 Tax=Pseudomonas aeruginosa TaxID=287 RepID=UPI00093C33D9|nr:chromosome partitioning protein ParA [Pseudomonas aeruginosa]